MKQSPILYNILIYLLVVFNFSVYAQIEKGMDIKHYPYSMNAFHYPKQAGCDSVIVEEYNEIWYYNLDSICYKIANTPDESDIELQNLIHYYYAEIVDYLPEQKLQQDIRKMREKAQYYKSDRLAEEIDFIEIMLETYPVRENKESFDKNIAKMHNLVNSAVKQKNRPRECLLLFEIFAMYKSYGDYGKAFKYCPEIIRKLDMLNDEEFPKRHEIYYHIGHSYYLFRDYKRALPLLRMAMRDTVFLFFDRWNLKARQFLGDYYASTHLLDSSDYYYRTLYDCGDMVRFRPAFDLVAASGIARNMITRKEYGRAVLLLEKWLPEALKQRDCVSIVGMSLSLADCYIAAHNCVEAKAILDTANKYRHKNRSRDECYYQTMSRYYKMLGNAQKVHLYADSAQKAIKAQNDKTDALIMLRAEQELFEDNSEQMSKKIAVQRNTIIMVSFVILILAIALCAYIYYSRRLYHKNVKLVKQMLEQMPSQAEKALFHNLKQVAPVKEKRLFAALEEYMQGEHPYTECNLNREVLAKAVHTNEKYLSDAIRESTSLTVNEYITRYRVEYARNLILHLSDKYTLEQVWWQAGFNSRVSFYRHFQKTYGMTPGEFRRILLKERL